MSLLDVSGLTVSAGRLVLVDDVSFMISAGERVGVIGESGSGKSVTSLAVTGLLAEALSASGSVLLHDTQVIGAPDRELRPLRGPVAGILFQEPLTALDPLMRVGRQIAEPMRRHLGLRGTALQDAVRAALVDVSLPDPRFAGAFPHELSGGQRQRVATAVALAARPRLLIADEPTTALDVTVQDEILTLLDRLVSERDMALMFISHDLAVVSRMTDRIVVMRSGRAIEQGTVGQIVGEPHDPYTAALVASARALDSALDAPASGASDGEASR
ncbi:ATP-binding cassette domain-containing protein [Microbacterium sp. TWP3-1-2b2]|uniref:ATP-binding cassette domain-containing protein n=1 Tax=Microbacterium sp. TWP3-1-2b2 TaxID=2804651 RepID=UPI003CEA65AB